MSRNYTYDYYEIDVPGDAGDMSDLHNIALLEAQDRTKLYCTPAEWSTEHISGDVGDHSVRFKVCRKRRRSAKRIGWPGRVT